MLVRRLSAARDLRLGNPTRWNFRQKACVLTSMLQEIRHALRLLARNLGFTAIAALSLALGIGANSAMFSLADALLLRPLPVLRPSEVVAVGIVESAGGFTGIVASYRDYIDFRDQSKSFDGLVAFADTTFGVANKRDALPQMKLGTI